MRIRKVNAAAGGEINSGRRREKYGIFNAQSVEFYKNVRATRFPLKSQSSGSIVRGGGKYFRGVKGKGFLGNSW